MFHGKRLAYNQVIINDSLKVGIEGWNKLAHQYVRAAMKGSLVKRLIPNSSHGLTALLLFMVVLVSQFLNFNTNLKVVANYFVQNGQIQFLRQKNHQLAEFKER